ncbi:MAG: hypothetical protein CL581_16295 [Alteromonadaceae bacterium]|uniref:hypothetical protein n=1 Tax=Marinobacter sp. V034 TaxID=3459610 RepID=UPI000C3BFBAA|nr:hypothetical protein [Alteromonadaceae bacterium]MBH84068.1 hypothetical protein [Alteromonadaceae bacterium]|tara:strand:- start:4217 stop:4648 length:432 start_codon:yes stop_codon:yes gene_type:complete
MTAFNLLMLAGIIACLGVTGRLVLENEKRLRDVYRRLPRLENRLKRAEFEGNETDEKRALLENTVTGGTFTVEFIHRAISTTTFDVINRLSSNERVRTGSEQARALHDDAAGGVYRSIRVANKQIHSLADIIIQQKRKRKTTK